MFLEKEDNSYRLFIQSQTLTNYFKLIYFIKINIFLNFKLNT